ncbi:MAG: carbamoyl-phosphate synthase large subunit, partial [Acidimicrobiales bacterium]
PVLPGTDGPTDRAGAHAFFDGLGPDAAVMVTAVAGGGGRGMRPVFDGDELDQALERCASEASGAFGSGDVYVEALLPRARHVEVQVLGDGTGAVTQFGDRDCSVQRHRQKLIEVAPAPGLDQGVRAALTAAAVSMAKELRYRGVGTFEFLVDLDDPGRWTFMEANPRLQVEHPVTEAVHGVDLVRAQLLVATGRTLDDLGLRQGDIRAAHGTAIEARITAASSGTVKAFDAPSGPGVRVDTALHRGAQVSPRYDSLLVKVVGHVPGGDVRDAARRTARAVAECVIAGIDTNADLLQGVLTHAEFLAGPVDTGFVERHLPDWAEKGDKVNPTTAE